MQNRLISDFAFLIIYLNELINYLLGVNARYCFDINKYSYIYNA